eukprot:851503-Rhodomonas_salina.1
MRGEGRQRLASLRVMIADSESRAPHCASDNITPVISESVTVPRARALRGSESDCTSALAESTTFRVL